MSNWTLEISLQNLFHLTRQLQLVQLIVFIRLKWNMKVAQRFECRINSKCGLVDVFSLFWIYSNETGDRRNGRYKSAWKILRTICYRHSTTFQRFEMVCRVKTVFVAKCLECTESFQAWKRILNKSFDDWLVD